VRDPSKPDHAARDAILDARARLVHTPPRVIVAEDDQEMRDLIIGTLRKEGYDVREAADGGRLLVQLTAQYTKGDAEVDLIISDVRMPICSGLEILEELRAAHSDVPVILMTAFGDDETRARAAGLGALMFDKPFSLDDLLTAVLNLVPAE
jgi:two-component system OmpR family response regulator